MSIYLMLEILFNPVWLRPFQIGCSFWTSELAAAIYYMAGKYVEQLLLALFVGW